MASRSRSVRRPLPPLAPAQPFATVRAPELDPSCNFFEIFSPAFDPNRLMLRRHFFLNDDKSKYV